MRLRRSSGVSLQERLAAFDAALAAADGRVPDAVLADARAVRRRVDERRARGDQAVVVALCGGTGTGKSSLFNALAGDELASVDVRRPTTAAAAAWAVGEPEEAAPLLDWLEVEAVRRHHSPAGGSAPEGLVLVDLPDVDSVEVAHRATADRLIARVDVLVWVVDPLKYAQRSLHEGYLARLREHADVMLVVLNHVDRLDADARRTCLRDLRWLVERDGRSPRVVATSATTGEGVAELRALVAQEVRHRRAVAERVAADVRAAAADLLAHLAPPGETDGGTPAGGEADGGAQLDTARLTGLLAAIAGVDAFAERGGDAYVTAARRVLRTPLVAVLAAVAGLTRSLAGGSRRLGRLALSAGEVGGERPVPDAASAELDIRHALLDLVEHARRALPWFWAERVRATAERASDTLSNALKAALAQVPLEPARRRWWTVTAGVWSFAELVAVAGLAWMVLVRLAVWLQMPRLPAPSVGDDVSVPGLLVAVGAAAWVVLAVVRRLAVRGGAHRHRALVARRAHDAVRASVRDTTLAPLQAELDAYQRLRGTLADAAA